MAYRITEACVACGTCQSECPCNAIEEGEIYKINQDLCAGCGTCASACPISAIVEE
ncbi:MAG: 4Fe-4S binding protein [Sphaerochaetaceae bacterium]